jgi:hypothetical protein
MAGSQKMPSHWATHGAQSHEAYSHRLPPAASAGLAQ